MKIAVLGGVAESLIAFRGPLLQRMVERGHEVIACAPAASSTVVERLGAIGVDYRDLPIDRTGLSPIRDVATLYAILALFRRIRPDIVLGYTVKPIVYGSLAARALGAKSFSLIEGLGYAFSTGGVKARLARIPVEQLYRLSLRWNERVFFLNPDDLALFKRSAFLRSPDQAVMIDGIGVDLKAYAQVPMPTSIAFLLMARLITTKGVRQYAEAARLLKARYPGTAFRLAGWIDDHPDAISEHELRAWVEEGILEYLGCLQDVRPAIAASSVYVLPSFYREGLPRSILEAMAMGRPIVTTDAPGCRETVQEGVNGYLVPVRDVRALVAALERFITNPDLVASMGRESRRIAVEKYDVHKVNAVILEAMKLA